MTTLNELTPREREALARKVNCNPLYLWQCGDGRRSPSLKLAIKLIKADTRLTMESLRKPKDDKDKAKARAKAKKKA